MVILRYIFKSSIFIVLKEKRYYEKLDFVFKYNLSYCLTGAIGYTGYLPTFAIQVYKEQQSSVVSGNSLYAFPFLFFSKFLCMNK